MVGVGNVQVGENGVEYVHNASNRSHGHLLAGCTCNDQLPRGKQKRSCFWLIHTGCDSSKPFFVVCTVGYACMCDGWVFERQRGCRLAIQRSSWNRLFQRVIRFITDLYCACSCLTQHSFSCTYFDQAPRIVLSRWNERHASVLCERSIHHHQLRQFNVCQSRNSYSTAKSSITKNTLWGGWKRDEKCWWIYSILNPFKMVWRSVNCSLSPTSFFKIHHFHPLLFSASPTCRFHPLVDFTYFGMPLGMLLSHSPGQFLGSYAINRVLTIRLVQRLKSIVHQRNKEKKTYLQISCTCTCLLLWSVLSVFAYTSFSLTLSFHHRKQFLPSDSLMFSHITHQVSTTFFHPPFFTQKVGKEK